MPIITLMVAMLEMSGLAATWVHLLMGALLVSRLLHPLGMYAAPNTLQFRIGRVGGITITLVLLMACALTILARALYIVRRSRLSSHCKDRLFFLRAILF